MHNRNAPAVQYPVGRSRMEALVLLLAAAAGTLAALAWAWQLGASPFDTWLGWQARPWWMLSLLACLLIPAARAWWRTPASLLGWDGAAWSWSAAAPGAVHGVQLAADVQWALLLRLLDARGRTLAWLWVQGADAPAQWKPLRRALVSAAARSPVPGQAPASQAAAGSTSA